MQRYYLTLDIGGTYIKYASINSEGNIGEKGKVKTPKSLDELFLLIDEIWATYKDKVNGIAISCPGRVDTNTGTVYKGGALPYLDGTSFKKILEDKYNMPCAVCNDGKAAALAELWLGHLQSIENGAAIVLGTGVGGGIIVNGRIIQGDHYQAGELSFLLRSPESTNTDHFIGFSGSAVNFIRKSSQLLELDKLDDGIAVFEAINEGNHEELIENFTIYCREIVFIIHNLQAILDISKVVIGGGVSAQPILIKGIREQYNLLRRNSKLIDQTFEAVEIEVCKFGSEANLLGALYQLLVQLKIK